ncbi:Cytochrome c-552 [Roseovarius litorisediminis]|uniref:Cytochrome c-552 n=1 Tax=Roseovarius litorisediminis TaxID=1312363 RepID=A0A1Y5TF37_9RHOB|nr:cytochrome c family protein [Roseovarius litorisediminis]SLN60473.1 Cytochrome c-552 [Roseovarius litorisediminis]
MFDTMRLTKIVGSLCGALLILLLSKWAAELLYTTGGGHGDGHSAAYVIDTGEADAHGEAAADEGPSLAELFAAADLEKGAKVFGKCKACHKLEDGANATGPYLYGVVGRKVDSAAGYGYSGALEKVVEVWTPEALDGFLENPKSYAPGTAMGFSGLKKPEDRANVIAYLDQTDGTTYEMDVPAAEEASAEEPAVEETHQEAAAEEPAAEEPAAEEPVAEEPAAEEPAAEEPAAEEAASTGASGFAGMVAAADLAKGEKVYKKCKACHALEDGKNRVGPHLFGLVGRAVASVDGFGYSGALQGIGGDWTVDQLNAWLEDPKGFAPGNKMSFAGVRKEEDRAAVIAYLGTIGN